MNKWKGWDVLGGKFDEKMERWGLYLKEGSMREWKGWDVLEGKFNGKMERLGVL